MIEPPKRTDTQTNTSLFLTAGKIHPRSTELTGTWSESGIKVAVACSLVTSRLGFSPLAVAAPDLPSPTVTRRQLASPPQPGHRGHLWSTQHWGPLGFSLCRVTGKTRVCRRQTSAEPLLPEHTVARFCSREGTGRG